VVVVVVVFVVVFFCCCFCCCGFCVSLPQVTTGLICFFLVVFTECIHVCSRRESACNDDHS
jgi:hypothetical protein